MQAHLKNILKRSHLWERFLVTQSNEGEAMQHCGCCTGSALQRRAGQTGEWRCRTSVCSADPQCRCRDHQQPAICIRESRSCLGYAGRALQCFTAEPDHWRAAEDAVRASCIEVWVKFMHSLSPLPDCLRAHLFNQNFSFFNAIANRYCISTFLFNFGYIGKMTAQRTMICSYVCNSWS